jgi:hypothetical protein
MASKFSISSIDGFCIAHEYDDFVLVFTTFITLSQTSISVTSSIVVSVNEQPDTIIVSHKIISQIFFIFLF